MQIDFKHDKILTVKHQFCRFLERRIFYTSIGPTYLNIKDALSENAIFIERQESKSMEDFRLQKFLAASGVASRRASEAIISQGRVFVNGRRVTDPAIRVTVRDRVTVDGKTVRPSARKVYIMLNKPVSVLSSSSDDRGRRCVVELVDIPGVRLFAVGRLDYDTSGLILLTNDGEFMQRITHPSFEVWKTYEAVVKGVPNEQTLKKLKEGVMLEDGVTLPAHADIIGYKGNNAVVEIHIREGRNRQVRRMLETVNYPVISLKRTQLGGLMLGDLKIGSWRYLKRSDFESLFGKAEAKELGYV